MFTNKRMKEKVAILITMMCRMRKLFTFLAIQSSEDLHERLRDKFNREQALARV